MFNVDRVIDVSADLPTWVRDTVVLRIVLSLLSFLRLTELKAF